MKVLLRAALALSISQMIFGQTAPAADSRNTGSSGWNQLVDNFFDDFYKLNPTQGTAAGFHQYDSDLEDYSRQGIENQIAFAKSYLGRVNAFDSKSLSVEERQDYQLLANDVKSTLLELEDIRSWEKTRTTIRAG